MVGTENLSEDTSPHPSLTSWFVKTDKNQPTSNYRSVEVCSNNIVLNTVGKQKCISDHEKSKFSSTISEK